MEYEVGRYYKVRCAKMVDEVGNFYFVPIIGEAHFDLQFGFKEKHYHIDGRFVGKDEHSRMTFEKGGLTNAVCSIEPSMSIFVVKDVVLKRRKCRRMVTGLRPPKRTDKDFYGRSKAEKYWNWYDKMVGKSCKGKRCPHLGTEMREQDGKLVCPLHNLIGDKETELIIAQ